MARVGDTVTITGTVVEVRWPLDSDDGYEVTVRLDDKASVKVPDRFARPVSAKAMAPAEDKAVHGPMETK